MIPFLKRAWPALVAGCVLGGTLAWAAAITLSPPAIIWGSGNVQTPVPSSLIGYDSSGGLPCIVGSTPTCQLSVHVGGGSGETVTANQGTPAVVGNAWPVSSIPAVSTPAAPDISTVTTGGTAVNAFSAGHCTRGCYLINPKAATIDLCVNGVAVASGTVTVGSLICVLPGQSLFLPARSNAISVVSSDSAHPFGGEGYQ